MKKRRKKKRKHTKENQTVSKARAKDTICLGIYP